MFLVNASVAENEKKINSLGFDDHRVAKNAIHDVHKNIIG
jgi:hypothetical protein